MDLKQISCIMQTNWEIRLPLAGILGIVCRDSQSGYGSQSGSGSQVRFGSQATYGSHVNYGSHWGQPGMSYLFQ
jgi:hypothetical protein